MAAAASSVSIVCGDFEQKVLLFFKNTIQRFYCCDYQYRRLYFLRGIVLEFEAELDGMVGDLDINYRSWLSSCIIHIRDIRSGYGLRDIAYALLVVWYRRYPEEADLVMRRFVCDVGCWSDIKRFLGLWRELGGGVGCGGGDGVMGRVVAIMIDQLWLDYEVWSQVFGDYMKKRDLGGHCSRPRAGDYISFASKWVPREKSSYGWLYDHFVIAWAAKAGWRGGCGGGCMDRWRKGFRKIVTCLNCVEVDKRFYGSSGMEAKDFVRMAYRGVVDEAGWRAVLDRFCSVVELAIDTIPVVEFQYDDFGKDDFWRAISYAILISQRGVIGRFMLGDAWIVCRREDDLLDIVSRIRRVLERGGVDEWRVSEGGNALELLIEASEVSGYECRDKIFYIGIRNNINI